MSVDAQRIYDPAEDWDVVEESESLPRYQALNVEWADIIALDKGGLEAKSEEGADGASATHPAHPVFFGAVHRTTLLLLSMTPTTRRKLLSKPTRTDE